MFISRITINKINIDMDAGCIRLQSGRTRRRRIFGACTFIKFSVACTLFVYGIVLSASASALRCADRDTKMMKQ